MTKAAYLGLSSMSQAGLTPEGLRNMAYMGSIALTDPCLA